MADIRDADRVIADIERKIRESITKTVAQTAQYAESKLSELFKAEGRTLNVEWSQLKEAYLKQKIKKGFSEKILHKTTTLAQSFTSQVKTFEAAVGTPVWYASFHEHGTRRMPARAFMKPVFEHVLSSGIIGRLFKEVIKGC
ncbi:HK97-gp10 family putative phage morphogenesis protein [Thermodesulfovibrio thiophilus]|uniref:HK97-gp10 family putative phage morphogenesis protein n=1 Tax=Thermodesulfovibrio thiophilus TaxID=340095 RepID=UPI00040576DB|nr:HK97-gp10 family putative phage morphogenesis protein [Thermodesulfovibrio thiophilus]